MSLQKRLGTKAKHLYSVSLKRVGVRRGTLIANNSRWETFDFRGWHLRIGRRSGFLDFHIEHGTNRVRDTMTAKPRMEGMTWD